MRRFAALLALLVVGCCGLWVEIWALAGYTRQVAHIRHPADMVFLPLMAFDDGTIWAPGCSEERLARVHVGMPETEVVGLIGRPLWDHSDGHQQRELKYTRGQPDRSYWYRAVWLDKNGRVSRLEAYYFAE